LAQSLSLCFQGLGLLLEGFQGAAQFCRSLLGCCELIASLLLSPFACFEVGATAPQFRFESIQLKESDP
jgi:hypothetical protein